MRSGALVSALLAALAGAAFFAALRRQPAPATPSPAERPIVVDSRRFDFLEDEGTGRRLAQVRVGLERAAGGGVSLRIVAAATGPRIDPIPGWQGVAGANRITAEEIASILEKGRLRVETDGIGSDPIVLGTASAGLRGRIPERRTGPDGSIDFRAESDAEYPLELVVTTPPLGSGTRRTRLVVDGRTRLEITTVTSADRGRIRDVSELSELDGTRVVP